MPHFMFEEEQVNMNLNELGVGGYRLEIHNFDSRQSVKLKAILFQCLA